MSVFIYALFPSEDFAENAASMIHERVTPVHALHISTQKAKGGRRSWFSTVDPSKQPGQRLYLYARLKSWNFRYEHWIAGLSL